jgi:hypothetical protein
VNVHNIVMWGLQLQYVLLFALAASHGNIGKSMYWIGVVVLNFGVLFMK